MRSQLSRLPILLSLFILFPVWLKAEIGLPAMVGNGMVLQRDQEVIIWGWAEAKEKLTVEFRNQKYEAITATDGRWQIKLAGGAAGGPFEMRLYSAQSEITLTDILVGDVWLCAGQSNMVHNLGRHSERYDLEISEASYPAIRQFLVPGNPRLVGPQEDLAGGEWQAANPESVLQFSVVAYFFAKDLYDRYGIPVGLINASVGGTPAEAWISEEGLKNFSDIQQTIQNNKDTAAVARHNQKAQQARNAWYARPVQDKGLIGKLKWYDPAYQPVGWKTINIPGYWEDQGIRGLDGVVWYRREIDVPDDWVNKAAKLSLGRIVDADEVYVNGQKIGNTTYQYPQRRYEIPAGVLQARGNVFVVRVTNDHGKGGFVPDKPYYLEVDGQQVDLKGYWSYKVGEVFGQRNFPSSISLRNQPTALYNGMVAPYTNYAIKGVLWYQGESNSGRPAEYAKLLPALVKDWRAQWEHPLLPFFVVQLPNFMEVNYSPEESNWAAMRAAQMKILSLPQTGLAVTIDLGEWNDIHPGRKKPIGERLALIARAKVYGEEDLVYAGPIVHSAKKKGTKVELTFEHVGGGLVTSDGEVPRHFAVAGVDKVYRWAKATIEGDQLVIWSTEVNDPAYVRYAWADNPDFANLYNEEGLPAAPFEVEVVE